MLSSATRTSRPRLTVESRDGGDAYLVIVRGEVDLASGDVLRGVLQDAWNAREPTVVVDLSEVEFMDSTGLHLLLNTLRRLTRQGRRLELVCSEGPVKRVFETTRLADTFDIRPAR